MSKIKAEQRTNVEKFFTDRKGKKMLTKLSLGNQIVIHTNKDIAMKRKLIENLEKLDEEFCYNCNKIADHSTKLLIFRHLHLIELALNRAPTCNLVKNIRKIKIFLSRIWEVYGIFQQRRNMGKIRVHQAKANTEDISESKFMHLDITMF